MKKPNRLRIHLSPIFATALFLHSATHSASATNYYWDNDGATTGFGSAAGTWAAPTVGDVSQGWSTDATGATLPVQVTTTTSDAVFFGNGATGLGAGTIAVSGIVDAADITFAAGSGNIVLDGGTINGGGSNRTITVAGGTHTFQSVLSGAGNRIIAGSGTLVLNGLNTFSGSMVTIGNNTASTLLLRVNSIANGGDASALGAGTGLIQIGTSGQSSTLELFGSTAAQTTNRQVRVGADAGGSGGSTILNNNTDPAHSLTFTNAIFNQNNTSSVSGSNRTLILGGSNTGDNTISGAITELLGTGLMPVTKTGPGKWILNGANSYDGATTVNDGILVLGGSNSVQTTTTINTGGTLHLNSSINGGLPDGAGASATDVNFGHASAVVQAINADRTITNRLVMPGTSGGATVSGNFSLTAGILRLLNGNKILTNNIASGKSLTLETITTNQDNRNLTINGTGTTLVTGILYLGNTGTGGTLTKGTGGSVKLSTAGVTNQTSVTINTGAAGGVFVAANNGQRATSGAGASNFTLGNGSTLVIDYGSSTPSTTVAPLALTNFNVGTGLNLLVEGNTITSLVVGQSYPLVNWTTAGPADGSAFTTVLTPGLAGNFSVSGNTLFLTVTAVPGPGGYITWAGLNAGGQDPNLDYDFDGVSNGVEFFMNVAAGFTANPQLNASKAITWINGGNIPASAYGTKFVVQTSTDLSVWTNVLIDDPNLINTNESLSYTLTGGSSRFVRLSVSPN